MAFIGRNTYFLYGSQLQERIHHVGRGIHLIPNSGYIRDLAVNVKPVVSTLAARWLTALLDWDSSSEQSIINVLNMVKQWEPQEIAWHPDLSHSNQEALAAAYYLAGAFYDPGVGHIGSSDVAAETIDINKALEMYQAGLQMRYRLRVLIQSSAFALYKLGRYDEELQILCRAIDADPAHSGAYAWRGQVYEALQQYDEALADYTRALELASDEPEWLDLRSTLYRIVGRYEEALADLNRAIELQPNKNRYIYQRGLIHASMQQNEKAVADFTQSLDLGPYLWGLYNRGSAYYDLGQYEHALEDYTQALELFPNDLHTLYRRALVYQDIYQYENALADLTNYLELNPDDPTVLSVRGNIYRKYRQYDEALADYDRSIDLETESSNRVPFTFVRRGNCYADMGQFEQAFADYEYARSLGTYQDWPLFGMAIAFALQGKPTETLHYLQQAIDIDANVRRSVSQGYHYQHAFQPLRNKDPMFAVDFDDLVADKPPIVEQTERLKEVIATFTATFSALSEVQQTVLFALSACAQPNHAAMVARIAGCTIEEAQTALIQLKEQSLIHYEAGQDRPYSLPSAVQIVVSQRAGTTEAEVAHLAFAQSRSQAYQHIDDQQTLEHDLPEILTAIDRCIATGDIQRAWEILQPMQGWLTAHSRQNDFTSRCWQILSRAPEVAHRNTIAYGLTCQLSL
jgi:tetratricopeptide (TPR) repeat protein